MCPEGGDDDYLAAEARARVDIDRMLSAAGWSVQHLKDMNLGASLGVAVREVPLVAGHGRADYVLFVEQERIVMEADRQLSLIDVQTTAIDVALKHSATLRRAILDRAFTGKLVPQDPDDEPASALLERIRAERKPAEKRTRAAARS